MYMKELTRWERLLLEQILKNEINRMLDYIKNGEPNSYFVQYESLPVAQRIYDKIKIDD